MTGLSSGSALQVSDNFLLLLNINRFPFEDVPFPFCIATARRLLFILFFFFKKQNQNSSMFSILKETPTSSGRRVEILVKTIVSNSLHVYL